MKMYRLYLEICHWTGVWSVGFQLQLPSLCHGSTYLPVPVCYCVQLNSLAWLALRYLESAKIKMEIVFYISTVYWNRFILEIFHFAKGILLN
jgi:hypothetical protein